MSAHLDSSAKNSLTTPKTRRFCKLFGLLRLGSEQLNPIVGQKIALSRTEGNIPGTRLVIQIVLDLALVRRRGITGSRHIVEIAIVAVRARETTQPERYAMIAFVLPRVKVGESVLFRDHSFPRVCF